MDDVRRLGELGRLDELAAMAGSFTGGPTAGGLAGHLGAL